MVSATSLEVENDRNPSVSIYENGMLKGTVSEGKTTKRHDTAYHICVVETRF